MKVYKKTKDYVRCRLPAGRLTIPQASVFPEDYFCLIAKRLEDHDSYKDPSVHEVIF